MKVLVIQTAFLGDVILTTPMLKTLADRGAEIHFIGVKAGVDVLKDFPQLHTHELIKGRFKRGVQSISELLSHFASQEGQEFDFIFCVHRSLRTLWLAKKIKAKRKIAFQSISSKILGFESVPYPAYSEDLHYSDRPMALLKKAGIEFSSTPKPYLSVTEEAKRSVQNIFPWSTEKYVVINPFSVWGTKIWPKFPALIQRLADTKQIPFVLIGTGGKKEIAESEEILKKLPTGHRVFSMVGRTSIEELKALISGASLLVSNDSAPVHIASAFNVPTVAIFGPTVKKFGFFPQADRFEVVEKKHIDCRPCSLHGPKKCPRGHFRCMREIEVEDVYQAIQRVS